MTAYERGTWGYLIAWQFHPGRVPNVNLKPLTGRTECGQSSSMQGEGFIATELSRDLQHPRRSLTLDFWASKEAHEQFRSEHVAEYKEIDVQCEELTEQETELGRFERLT